MNAVHEQGIGKDVLRKEDLRFLSGRGRYTTDLDFPGMACAVMVRSPHAHARIARIDSTAARAMQGVLAVLTGADAAADGLAAIPHTQIAPGTEKRSPHFVLPRDKARFVGEAVAMVIADSAAAARDAAEAVEVQYQTLPAVSATPRAADLPSFDTFISEVPATNHPLGIRAGSESGTPPALCVAVSAIVDALSEFGVKHLEMPVTAERIWRAINI